MCFTFRNHLSWKRVGSFIWTNMISHHPRMLCAKFGWNWPSGSGEEDENVKSLRRRRRQQRQRRQRTTDKFWSEKLTWAFGSGELKRSILGRLSALLIKDCNKTILFTMVHVYCSIFYLFRYIMRVIHKMVTMNLIIFVKPNFHNLRKITGSWKILSIERKIVMISWNYFSET